MLTPNKLPGLLQRGDEIRTQVGEAQTDLCRRDSEDTLADGVHPSFSVHHKEIAAIAARQNKTFLSECRLETDPTIGMLEACPDDFPYGVNIEAQSPGLFLLGARRREADDALALVWNRC